MNENNAALHSNQQPIFERPPLNLAIIAVQTVVRLGRGSELQLSNTLFGERFLTANLLLNETNGRVDVKSVSQVRGSDDESS